ncbi:MAG: long-chain fatty acid--CoA ligase [Candidatus Aminicenantes bacterium]|nr:long-chain fatty acid--CoA ligase [Candidatus Aminicenantes bacterium]MDH5383667.1 long-chain fatty acid--CoA ligase [Candidatus Aminicenantes bacterium]MDH5743361.1 long-chain fatty acid--CoA ligase [Candidatus Aminicenantes bacterium]
MLEKSIYEMFKNVCEKNKDKVAYKYKDGADWKPVTWAENQETCKRISKSLMALGVGKDDKVNILSWTRLEWIQVDFATVSIGAVIVGIYPNSLADDCAYIINHSDAVVLFVENKDQLDKITEVRNKLPNLKHVVIIDGESSGADGVITWQEFIEKEVNITDDEFFSRTAELQPGDVASIVYTSGTTGVPKGAMLTHENLVFTPWSVIQSLYIEPHFENLLFLPLAHVFARIIVYVCLRGGLTVSIAESMETVVDNLKEIRPHFFGSPPRLYERAYARITSNVHDAGGIKYKLFKWALGVGYAVSQLQQQKKPVTGLLAFKHKLANKLVFSKIQAALGGRVVYAISGAAPLNKSIAEFFHACGVLILEGIGMTENTSFTNVNLYDHYKFGSVGPTGPEIEQKIAPDGEVLYRGKNVMLGYYKDPEATAETIDNDGWLYTGDMGKIDEDGFLSITDRKKDLIITSGGKNVAPQRVEKIMETSRYINQVVMYGERKKYLTAVVTLDQGQVEEWATKLGIPYSHWEELCGQSKVQGLIDNEVAEKNKLLSSFETLKKVLISPEEFSIESGELTASLKIKRHIVTEKFRDRLDALYED